MVDVQVLRTTRNLTLPALPVDAELQELLVLKKGSGLSITPVLSPHWEVILQRFS